MSEETQTQGRVLLIDDDEVHAESLADALEMDGYECEYAASGEEGLERIGTARFDAVLTDLRESGLKI